MLPGRLALWLKAALIAMLLAAGLPLQWLALKLPLSARRRLPLLFHRALARVIGIQCGQRGDLPASCPVLLVGNHVSWLDIIALGSLHPVSFIARADMAGWPLFGMLARLQTSIFIDRARRADVGRVNEVIAARLASGGKLVLFAEGTTGDGNRVLPFRPALLEAASRQAEDGGFSVQPFAIAYTRRNGLPLSRADMPAVAWYGDMQMLPHLSGILAGGPIDVTVAFGRPVNGGLGRKALAAALETEVRLLWESIRR